MEKNCLECGAALIGRSDKKYCDDSCRNAYNNKLHIGDKNLVRNINNKLKKNYRILSQLNVGKDFKTKVKRDKMLHQGFDFGFMTSIYKTQSGSVYYYCYNQGYLLLEGDYVLLVKKE